MCSARVSREILRPAVLATLEVLESRLLLSAYAPTQLAFLGSPGSAANASDPISPAISVAVEDASGDIVSTDNSVVMLRLASGKFGNHQSTLVAAAVDGVATFDNVILKKNGDHTLDASAGNLAPGTQGGFWVGPLTIDSKSALALSTVTLSGPALNSSQEYKIDFRANGVTVQSPLTSVSPIQVMAPIPLNGAKTAISASAFHLSLEEPDGGVLPISGSLSVKPFPQATSSLGSATIDYLQSVQAALNSTANTAAAVAADSTGAALAQSQLAQLSSVIAGEIQSIENFVAGGSEPVVVTNDSGSQILLSQASLRWTDEMFAELSQAQLSSVALAPDDATAWAQSVASLIDSERQVNGVVAQGAGLIDSYDLPSGQLPSAKMANVFAAGTFFALNTIPLAYSTQVDAGATFINPPAGQGIPVLRQYGFIDQVNYFGELSASLIYNRYGGASLTDVSSGSDDAAAAAADAYTDINVKGGIGRELLEAADTGDAPSVAYYATTATSDGLLAQYRLLPEPGVTPSPPPVTPPPTPVTPNPPPSNPVSPAPPPTTPTPPPTSPPPTTPTPPPTTPSPPPTTPTPPPYTPSPPPTTPAPPPYTPSPPPTTPTPPPYTPSPPPTTPTPPPTTPTPPPYTNFVHAGNAPGQSATASQSSNGKSGDASAPQSPQPEPSQADPSQATATSSTDTSSSVARPFVTSDASSALDNTTYNTDSAADSDDDPAAKFESSEDHQTSDSDEQANGATTSTSTLSSASTTSSAQGTSPGNPANSPATNQAGEPETSVLQGADGSPSGASATPHDRSMEQAAADRGFKPRWAQSDPASDPMKNLLARPLDAPALSQNKPADPMVVNASADPIHSDADSSKDRFETANTVIPRVSAQPITLLTPAVTTPISTAAANLPMHKRLAGKGAHEGDPVQPPAPIAHPPDPKIDSARADSLESIVKPPSPTEIPIDGS